MTVSDANPIQFWPTGEETYNEKEICGVYKECYCQKFNCDDTIKTQILAPSGGQFEMRMLSDTREIISGDFTEVADGVYENELVFNNELGGEINVTSDWYGNTDYTQWGPLALSGSTQPWIEPVGVGTGVDSDVMGASDFTNYYRNDVQVDINEGITYEFSLTYAFVTGGSGTRQMRVELYLLDESSNIVGSANTGFFSSSGTVVYTNDFSILATGNGTRIAILARAGASNTANVRCILRQLTYNDDVNPLDACNEQAQLKIYDVSQIGALAGFTNRSHSFVVDTFANWTLGSNPTITFGSTNVSALAIENFPSFTGNTYIIEYGCDFGANGANLYIVLLDENYNLTHVLPSIPESGLDEVVDTIEITPTSNGSYIAFFIQNGGVVNTFTMHTLEVLSPTETELYHSDCIEFKEDHECTQLITYSSSKNFDGLVFETIGSPTPGSFNLRIPAQFYQEGEPMEQEDHEKSNGEITTLRQSVQSKRLLEIGYMPGYMHRKLRRVLMMSSILIDGKYWKRRDSYDDNPVKRYTMKKASVWLTEYNSVKKNTL